MTLSMQGLQAAQIRELNRQARHQGKTTSEYLKGIIERELVLANTSRRERRAIAKPMPGVKPRATNPFKNWKPLKRLALALNSPVAGRQVQDIISEHRER